MACNSKRHSGPSSSPQSADSAASTSAGGVAGGAGGSSGIDGSGGCGGSGGAITTSSTSNNNHHSSERSHQSHHHHQHHHHNYHPHPPHNHNHHHHHHHRAHRSASSSSRPTNINIAAIERMASSSALSSASSSIIRNATGWFQRKINLRPAHRGCHLITDEVLKQIPEIGQFQVGICHLHIMHTSASLTLNENWDPDVREDMEMFLSNFVSEDMPFRHTCEGPDDMPAHVKACFLGSSLSLPVTEGKLGLGTWQGIWLCEHRNTAGSRKIMVTISGALKP